jgi:hypothetical protein
MSRERFTKDWDLTEVSLRMNRIFPLRQGNMVGQRHEGANGILSVAKAG